MHASMSYTSQDISHLHAMPTSLEFSDLYYYRFGDGTNRIFFLHYSSVYVHRVGRVARAGSSGVSYSLVASDEFAYMMDLHLFLGRPLQFVTPQSTNEDDALIGGVPQHLIDEEDDIFKVDTLKKKIWS